MNERDTVIAVFARELPHTVRLMNAPSVTEEIVFGPNVTPDEDEMPGQAIYDHHERVLDELVEDDILQQAESLGIVVYGLTVKYQEQLRGQVLNYVQQKGEQLEGWVTKPPVGMSAAETDEDRLLHDMRILAEAQTILREGDEQ